MHNRLQEFEKSGKLEEQIQAALSQNDATVLSAVKVTFDPQTEETRLFFEDKKEISLPTRKLQGLADVSVEILKNVSLIAGGTLLSWDDDAVVLSVEGLSQGRYGSENFMERQLLSEVGALSEDQAKAQISFFNKKNADGQGRIEYPLGLAVAARATAKLPYEERVSILKYVKENFLRGTLKKGGDLKKLAQKCFTEISRMEEPYLQGEKAAQVARDFLKIPEDISDFPLFKKIEEVGISVKEVFLDIEGFRGLSVWGKQYGPGILLNLQGDKGEWDILSTDHPVTRLTLAHELGHSLLDPSDWSDGSKCLQKDFYAQQDYFSEARAIAFAGEFLLPASVARKEWEKAGCPKEEETLKKLIKELSFKYCLPAVSVSWKIEHGAKESGCGLRPVLDSLFKNRR